MRKGCDFMSLFLKTDIPSNCGEESRELINKLEEIFDDWSYIVKSNRCQEKVPVEVREYLLKSALDEEPMLKAWLYSEEYNFTQIIEHVKDQISK